ncbi:MAG: sensor hybrid histidine kinase [Chitinophagaceae bacterium]|nr:sensor hybrid histidine kinase [Chitinophagaceae bacterium]
MLTILNKYVLKKFTHKNKAAKEKIQRIILAVDNSFIRLGFIEILKGGIQYLLFFCVIIISSGAVAQTTVDTKRTIKVVMDNNYAPYVFQSEGGKLQGILIDQWQAWEKKTGIKVEIHAMDWSDALQRMRAGDFDVIDCIVETAERQDYFDFTPAYNMVEASIYFRNNISGISDITSLKGFPVGVKIGDQHIDKLKAGGIATLILFHNNDAIIEAAKNHTINVFLADDPSALYLLNKLGAESGFRHTAPIFRDELRRAVRKGDTATLNTVSQGFAAIDPREFKQIDEKWFGLTINRNGRYLTYAGYAVVVAILLIAGLVAWNRTLRKRVLHRTTALNAAYQHLSYHVENTPLAVVEWDKDMLVKRWSLHAEEIFGWPASEALGKNMYGKDFPIVYEEDIQTVKKISDQLTSGMVDRNISLNRNHTKDGNVIYCEWYNSILRDKEGNVITILSLVHNVTERKKAEETLEQSYAEIRRLNEHLQKIREEERIYIAREIHDELGSQLSVLKMDVSWLKKKLDGGEEAIKQKIGDLINLLDAAVKSVRKISSELRPGLLDDLGLVAAMEWYLKEFEKRSGIKITFNEREELEIPDSIKTCLFRIFQESLTNVARHSDAKEVKVKLQYINNQLILNIEDNGKGFDKQKIGEMKTLGILGMKERAMIMNGSYDINSVPGKGTIITAVLPYKNEK